MLLRNIKNNPTIRGIYILFKQYLGIRRSNFGYCADNVIITPPFYRES